MSGIIGEIGSKSKIISSNAGIGTSSPRPSDWNANMRLLHIYKNDTNGSGMLLESSNCKAIFATGNDHLQMGCISNDPVKLYSNSNVVGEFGGASGGVGIAGLSAGANSTCKVHGSLGASSLHSTSDRRAKTNIVDSKVNATELINKLKIRDFNWEDSAETSYNKRNLRGTTTGIIAQEAIEHIPIIIHTPRVEETLEIDHESEEMWGVDSAATQGLLLKAVQELSSENTAMKTKIEALEARLTKLEAE